MKAVLLPIIFLTIFLNVLCAQNITIVNNVEAYDLPAVERNHSIVLTSSDKSIWYAYLDTHRADGPLVLLHYDNDENLIDSFNIDGQSKIMDMITDEEGNLYLLGIIRSELVLWDGQVLLNNPQWNTNAYFIKVQPNGMIEYSVNLNQYEEFVNGSSISFKIAQIDQEVFIPYYQNGSIVSNSGILHFDIKGDLVKNISFEEKLDIKDIKIDNDGMLYLSGFKNDGNVAFSYFVRKINAAGQIIWERNIEDWEFIHDMTTHLYVDSSRDELVWMISGSRIHFKVEKLDLDGNFLWDYVTPESQDHYDYIFMSWISPIKILSDGKIVFSCISKGNHDWGNGFITESSGQGGFAHVLIIDNPGVVTSMLNIENRGNVFTKSFTYNDNGDLYLSLTSFGTLKFNDEYIHDTSEPTYRRWLIKFDNALVSNNYELSIQEEVKLFPNPAGNYINITSPFDFDVDYEIYNISGQRILQGRHQNLIDKIELPNLAAGVYFYKRMDKNPSSAIKFIVQ